MALQHFDQAMGEGATLMGTGDFPAAAVKFRTAHNGARSWQLRAEALRQLGRAYDLDNDLENALRAFDEARRLTIDPFMSAVILRDKANAYISEAVRLKQRADIRYAHLGIASQTLRLSAKALVQGIDKQGWAGTVSSIGRVDLLRGDIDAAKKQFMIASNILTGGTRPELELENRIWQGFVIPRSMFKEFSVRTDELIAKTGQVRYDDVLRLTRRGGFRLYCFAQRHPNLFRNL